MSLDELPGWLEKTPLFAEANRRFLNETPERLADWLMESLEKAGVAKREGEWLVAA